MNLHQTISQELQCSRLWVDRALTMFNLIAAMSYLSINDKAKLVALLIEKFEKDPVPAGTIKELFGQTPLEDWASLPRDLWESIILGLGGDAVPEQLPICLTELIGVEPAEPDEEEIASMKKEMWDNYVPPEFVPASLEEESSEEIILTEEEVQLESPEPKGSWGVIFRSYSPLEKQFSYTLLNTNRTLSSSKIAPRQFWSTHRLTDWAEAQTKEPLCFQTPTCEEEEEIIKDFIRQEGPFDCLYLFSIEQNLPSPFFSETFSVGSSIQVEQAQQLFCSALGFQIRNQASLEWSGGLKPLNLSPRSIIDPRIPKTKLSWQVLAQWKISLRQVSGKTQHIPAVWKLNIKQNQRLHGSGGQAGQLNLRNACFLQLKDDENEYFIGNRSKEIQLPFRPFLNPDSHHQDLFLGEQVVELGSEASLIEKKVAPTLRTTPPIQEEKRQHFRTAIVSKSMEFSVFAEQSNQLHQKDPSLDAALSSSNIVEILIGLELIWGSQDAGFRLSIPTLSSLSMAKEEQSNTGTISLKQQIGSLELFSENTKDFNLSQEISRARTELKKEHPVRFNIQQTWDSSLENPAPLESPLHQSLQMYHDQIGWNIRSKS